MSRARRRVVATTVWLAALVAPAASFGAPSAKTVAAPEPALPPASVTLKVTPGSSGAPWRLTIENAGEGPVRIAADPRLLVLELTPPLAPEPEPSAAKADKRKKAPKPPPAPRCVLPDDARPPSDEGRELVVPPKRSWSTSFDPLFYCFGPRERAALDAGTTVKARFGWLAPAPRPGKKAAALAPPFAVTPVGASVGKVAPVKMLEADAFMLSESALPEPPAAPADEAASSTVTLSVPASMDAARGNELATTVTLTNGSDRPITLLYRPEMLQFSVSGPAGTVACGQPKTVSAPIRELFTTVAVNGRTSTTVLFTTTCPAGTFDEPGVYRLTPRLDTTNASGRTLGLKTWEGIAVGDSPLLLRVRTPRKPALPPRPTLD